MAETNGVKYLKINRLDANGEDYGSLILNADNIRINYPNTGPIQYDILTIQQQADYYLIGVIPQPTTSSFNEITEYTFTGSYDKDIGAAPGVKYLDDIGYWGTSYNPLNLFNLLTGVYTLPSTPNIPLKFNIDIKFTADPSNIGDFSMKQVTLYYNNIEFYLEDNPISIPPGDDYRLEYSFITTGSILNSFSILDGTQYKLGFTQINSVSSNSCRVEATWIIQNLTPSSSTPYFITNFSPDATELTNPDYDAILNNATTPQYSTIYQDIDYSTGLVPTNFELLTNGNAEYAPIQDSNYTATGWSNSRYKGSRASSPDFNVIT